MLHDPEAPKPRATSEEEKDRKGQARTLEDLMFPFFTLSIIILRAILYIVIEGRLALYIMSLTALADARVKGR